MSSAPAREALVSSEVGSGIEDRVSPDRSLIDCPVYSAETGPVRQDTDFESQSRLA